MFELVVVLILVMLNGVFALSELALVSARRSRLHALAEANRPGARSPSPKIRGAFSPPFRSASR